MNKRAERNIDGKLYVTAENLAGLLDTGRATAVSIGTAAGARVQLGAKCVRFNVAKVLDFMEKQTEVKEA